MNAYIKYPSTPHLPWSKSIQRDDTVIALLDGFIGQDIVITEKLDGENTTMYRDHLHARSLDSRHHPSRDWVKSFWSTICYKIPEGWRICGENVYARHSIAYEDLESYFYGFSIWNEDEALSWDETIDLFYHEFNIVPVPVLYRGSFDENIIKQLANDLDTTKHEGFVVRVADRIKLSNFSQKFAKWVRPKHVQTDQHWMHQAVIPNGLRKI